MTDLHLVSWNRPKMTELVIRTIHRNTRPDTFRLIVLDNASEEPVVEMLEGLSDEGLIHEFIPIKTNLGLEAARNLLLREMTDTKRFVCIDNDCLAPERDTGGDWLDKLNELMDKHEGYAAIAMRTQVMIGTGNIFEGQRGELVDFPHPGGSFRLMNTTITSRLGGWDREAPGRGGEERYICGKLIEAGYKCAFARKLECLHLFGLKDVTDRWGYGADMKPEDSGHSDIWHPALANGDDFEEVKKYAGEELALNYFKAD